jgi:hypothetical protein
MSNSDANSPPRSESIGITFISLIPVEILRRIFATLVQGVSISWNAPLGRGAIHPTPALTALALSHVCTTWRLVTIDYKDLWCAVDLAQPRFARLCMERSRPRNVHVFCRDIQHSGPNGLVQEPGPHYVAALEHVFQDSPRIVSLRLSEYPNQCTPHYEKGILPILTKLRTVFPRLKTLRGMSDPNLPWWMDQNILVNGASGSIRSLILPRGVLSHKVICSFKLVTLKIGNTFRYSEPQWRLLFSHIGPTLKHLEIWGEVITHISSPIVLPSLQTLLMKNAEPFAGMSLHAPRATRMTFQYDKAWEIYSKHDAVIQDIAGAINQRFRETTSAQPPFHLRYFHKASIMLSNSHAEFHLKFPCHIYVLASICRSLEPNTQEAVTRLELSAQQEKKLYGGQEQERNVTDHHSAYRDMVAHLPNLEEIWLDPIFAKDFLPWRTRIENQSFSLSSTLRVNQLTDAGRRRPDVDQALMRQVMDSIKGVGLPMELVLGNSHIIVDIMPRERG